MSGEDSDITFESLRSGGFTSRWWVATSIPFAGTGSWDRSTAIWLSWDYIIMVLLLTVWCSTVEIHPNSMFFFKSEVYVRIFMTRCLAWIYQTIFDSTGFYPYKLLEKNSGFDFSIFSQVKGLDIDQGLVLGAWCRSICFVITRVRWNRLIRW